MKAVKGGPRLWLVITGSVLIFILALVAGIVENRKGDPNCNCIGKGDRGWRAFSAVAISLGIPFFVLLMIYGFTASIADESLAQSLLSQGWEI